MQISCPRCGQQLIAPEELYGKTAKCNQCGNLITIPIPEPEPSNHNIRNLLGGVAIVLGFGALCYLSPAVGGFATVLAIAVLFGSAIAAVFLRAGIALYNKMAGGASVPHSIPEPTFGRAMWITFGLVEIWSGPIKGWTTRLD